jgi:hypothetical protein
MALVLPDIVDSVDRAIKLDDFGIAKDIDRDGAKIEPNLPDVHTETCELMAVILYYGFRH